ncbi:MAG: type II secretion system GspH family protein [Puniceicoccales bacterium]|jgi:hypothetical protein|nr:type II secretion system GspH family protein [Puniceicoccales bacterium]
MRTNRGFSLLETVFAITLLAVIVPTLFGIFFANANLSKNLLMQAKMRETAGDMEAFIKLSDYDSIYNMAKNGELLAIEEVEEDGFLTRNFVKYGSVSDKSKCKFVAKLELIDSVGGNGFLSDAVAACAIPLQCKVYHVKSYHQNRANSKAQPRYDMEYSMFFEKNR